MQPGALLSEDVPKLLHRALGAVPHQIAHAPALGAAFGTVCDTLVAVAANCRGCCAEMARGRWQPETLAAAAAASATIAAAVPRVSMAVANRGPVAASAAAPAQPSADAVAAVEAAAAALIAVGIAGPRQCNIHAACACPACQGISSMSCWDALIMLNTTTQEGQGQTQQVAKRQAKAAKKARQRARKAAEPAAGAKAESVRRPASGSGGAAAEAAGSPAAVELPPPIDSSEAASASAAVAAAAAQLQGLRLDAAASEPAAADSTEDQDWQLCPITQLCLATCSACHTLLQLLPWALMPCNRFLHLHAVWLPESS